MAPQQHGMGRAAMAVALVMVAIGGKPSQSMAPIVVGDSSQRHMP